MKRTKILWFILYGLIAMSCSIGEQITATATRQATPSPSVTVVTATPPPTATATILATAQLPEGGLAAYFPFEGDTNDWSGNGNHAAAFGPILTTDRFGRPDSAYQFDGLDDYMQIEDDDSLEFRGDFSIALWVNPQPPDDSEVALILSKFPPDGTPQVDAWWYGIDWDQNNRMEFSTAPQYDDESMTTQPVLADTWTCVVFTYQASDQEWTFYLNGLLDSQGNHNRRQVGTSADITIGSYGNGHNVGMYAGALDDIAIYQRTLSPEEALHYCLNNPLDIDRLPPNPTATLEPITTDCTQGWSRLTAGGQAVITPGSLPNRLRSDPLEGENILTLLYPGTVVQLRQGPVCSGGLVFWKVDVLIDGQTQTGWTAEGDLNEYWLEPYMP